MAVQLNANSANRGFQRTAPGAGDLSVGFWYRPADTAGNTATRILWDTNDGSNYWKISHAAADKITVTSSGVGGTVITSATAMSAATWYYIFVTQVAGGTVSIYIGTESTAISAADASGSSAAWPARYTTTMSVWKDHGITAEGIWSGDRVAYLRIWAGTALSTAQVEAERLKKSAVVTSNLWAEYDFAAQATMANDTSGNSRTLTLSPTGTSADWIDATDPSGLSEPSSFVSRRGLLGVG